MPYQKVPHRKVRTGCAQCKGRRIKCDETKPNCVNCVRYSSTCSYSVKKTSPDALCGDTYLDTSGNRLPSFSFADFELLHHWTLATAESLAPNASLQRAMREIVPRLAMKYRYLMHAALAITALHISYLRPDESESYLVFAARHESIALPLIRSGLTELDEENCHALYACGHLIIKYAFACPHFPGSLVFSSGIGTVAELVPLLRGAFSVQDHCREWLTAGPFASSLEVPLSPNPSFSLNPDDERLAALLPLFSDDSEDAAVCIEALNVLRRLFAMIASPGQTISTKTLVYRWLVEVPRRYLVLMSERNSKALVILAHYCIMLNMLKSFWFMEGCAAPVLRQCRQDLGEEWLPHIQWPLSVLGLPHSEE